MSTGVGERIKKRRIALDISQDTLAKRLGLKNKSSVCKVERGDDNLTAGKIRQYADALGVTPSYLMGWEDENGNEIVTVEIEMPNDDLHKKALLMYENYLNANPDIQSAIDTLLKLHQQDS